MKKQILAAAFLSLLGGATALPIQAQSSGLANNFIQLNASGSSLDKAKRLNIQVSYFIGSNLVGNLDRDPTLSDGVPFWELSEISNSSEGKSLIKLKDLETAEKIADQAISFSRQALSENLGDRESIRQLIISLRNRATLSGINRQYDQAEPQYLEALNVALSPDAKRHRIPLATELFNRLGLLSEMRGNDKQAEEYYQRGYNFARSISRKVTDIVVRRWNTAEVDSSGKITNQRQRTLEVPNINYEDEGFFNLCLNLGALYERKNNYFGAVVLTYTASKHAYENNSRRLTRPDIHELVRSRMFRIFSRLTPNDITSNNINVISSIGGDISIVRSFVGREYDLKLQNIFLNNLLSYESGTNLVQQTTNALVTLAVRLKINVKKDELTEDWPESFALRRALISKVRLLDAVDRQRANKCSDTSTASKVKELCNQLYSNYAALSNLVFAQQQGKFPSSVEKNYQDLNSKIDLLKEEIYRAVLSSYEPKSELKDFQALIPNDAALVEIVKYRPPKVQPKFNNWWDEWHYAAAVFKPRGNPHWVSLGKASDIDASVTKLRVALSDKAAAQKNELTKVQQASRLLNLQVMAKIRPLLGTAKHLLISADGELNLVPFEALQDEAGQYLITRGYQFSYLTSGRDLLVMAESRKNPYKARQDAVILADPDYYQAGSEVAKLPAGVSSLPNGQLSGSDDIDSVDSLGVFGSALGTEQLAKLLKSEILSTAQLLTKAAATKTALQQLPSPRILVLATHGFFLRDQEKKLEAPQIGVVGTGNNQEPQSQTIKIVNPLLRSGLALTGFNYRNQAKAGEDNGVLTALEVAGLNLQGTQLVVLSACETGVGETKVGDGVYGLRRALLIAGAQSQVLSLWKVDDDATKDLMLNYFRKMLPRDGKQGMGRHAALQKAKLEMMEDPKRQHPYYWASFIPSGDWSPLTK